MAAEWLEAQAEEFYNLMQAYRHAPLENQAATIDAFEAVKAWIIAQVRAEISLGESIVSLQDALNRLADQLEKNGAMIAADRVISAYRSPLENDSFDFLSLSLRVKKELPA